MVKFQINRFSKKKCKQNQNKQQRGIGSLSTTHEKTERPQQNSQLFPQLLRMASYERWIREQVVGKVAVGTRGAKRTVSVGRHQPGRLIKITYKIIYP